MRTPDDISTSRSARRAPTRRRPTAATRFRPAHFSPESLWDRLRVGPAYLPRYWWIGPAVVMVVAALLRFVSISHPNAMAFDETYYAKDGYSLFHFGYERQWPENANDSFLAGNPVQPSDHPEYAVHPPLGKWMIALGMLLFGDDNPLGWRFSAALFGTLSIAVLMWVAWMMFRSITLASIAGFLMAIDGLHIVQSRLALLDIFQMFWLLLAFALLVADRTASRRRLACLVSASAGDTGIPSRSYLSYGPWLGIRWWRIAAGIACGAAVGVKWNSLFFVAIFGILTVLWDISARRVVGVRNWFTAALLKDAWRAFISVVVVGLGTYLVTWVGWFASSDGFNRHWAQEHPDQGVQWLPAPLRSLWAYHVEAYEFHTHLDTPHTYMSPAWQWLILGRPTSYYYQSYDSGQAGCAADHCSAAILNVGNPLIWWSAAAAMIFVLIWWIIKRDWRMGAIFLVFAVAYLPWFAYPERTTFYFYALSFLPWLILGLTAVLGLGLGRPGDTVRRRRLGLIVVGTFLIAALLISNFFWPIWTGQTIPYDHWRWRMWFNAWI
nr:phospholipid carrier-dependent glycosyltransferase [Curtobacterium sp. S6]